uniref:NADH-ubiquinone oxidoreductase chain 4 n=1 Tax=Prionospio sp. 6 MH-2023 TaxID=3059274 RepID=A0AAU6QH15_9ANNE
MLMISLSLLSALMLMLLLPATTMWPLIMSLLMILSLTFLLSTSPSLSSSSLFLFHLDHLGSLMVILSMWISALMVLASQNILISKKSPTSFLFWTSSLSIILVLAFSSHNMLLFYVFFEASLIPTLLLILSWGYQPERLQASMYLIMYTVTASLPLLFSILFMKQLNGHISTLLPSWHFYAVHLQMSYIWWGITVLPFLVKTPLFLAHLWLPKAHVEAPVAGSMVLAGILLKLGSYGLLRFASKFFFLNKPLSPLIASIALIGGAAASFICIRQTDVKALIAYSSVSHMGLATSGIMSNTLMGWQGAFMMLVAHGLCSSCMFALANMTYESLQSRSMFLTKGIMTIFPSLTFWWFCFSACNMAAPPSINLGSEILLISSSLSLSNMTSLPLATMAFMAAAYSLFLYTTTQHGSLTSFNNPLQLLTPRNYSTCLLHLFPLVSLTLKMDIASMWI